MSEKQSSFRLWWQKPRKYGVAWEERRVSFLELFYDLVYVVIVAELGHTLAGHLDWQGFGEFVFLFFLVWIGWFNGTLYHDLHGNDDLRTRMTTFAQMVTIAAMAVFAHNALDDKGYQGFALSYAAFILILTILWWRAGVHDPEHRVVSQPYSLMYLGIATLFAVSALFPVEIAVLLWYVSIGLNLLIPILFRGGLQKIHEASGLEEMASETLVERFGLFTILVLAEIFVGVVAGMSDISLTFEIGIIAFFGLTFAFSIWWIYFGSIAEHLPVSDQIRSQIWMYLHFPLSFSITAVGASILYIIEHSVDPIAEEVWWILTTVLATILVSVVLLSFMVKIPEEFMRAYQIVRFVILFVLVLLIALQFVSLPTLGRLGAMAAVMVIPIVMMVYLWVQMLVRMADTPAST